MPLTATAGSANGRSDASHVRLACGCVAAHVSLTASSLVAAVPAAMAAGIAPTSTKATTATRVAWAATASGSGSAHAGSIPASLIALSCLTCPTSLTRSSHAVVLTISGSLGAAAIHAAWAAVGISTAPATLTAIIVAPAATAGVISAALISSIPSFSTAAALTTSFAKDGRS